MEHRGFAAALRDEVEPTVVIDVYCGDGTAGADVRHPPLVRHLDEAAVFLLEPQAVGLLGRVLLDRVVCVVRAAHPEQDEGVHPSVEIEVGEVIPPGDHPVRVRVGLEATRERRVGPDRPIEALEELQLVPSGQQHVREAILVEVRHPQAHAGEPHIRPGVRIVDERAVSLVEEELVPRVARLVVDDVEVLVAVGIDVVPAATPGVPVDVRLGEAVGHVAKGAVPQVLVERIGGARIGRGGP